MMFSVDSLVFYFTCVTLMIDMYFFSINFMNYFRFHVSCPLIRKDIEVNGIYPTLIELYTFLAILATLTIVSWNHEYSSSAEIHFSSIDSNVFDTHSLSNIIMAWIVFLLFAVETYFSFSRYFQVRTMNGSDFFSFKAHLPFFMYLVSFFTLQCLSLTILPSVSFLIMAAHIIINVYLGYYFFESIRKSYELVFIHEC